MGMFIKDRNIYLYLMSCINNATSDEERERYEDLLQLYLCDSRFNEMYIEEDDYIDEFDDRLSNDLSDYFN